MRYARILHEGEVFWAAVEGNYVRPIDAAPYEEWNYLGNEIKLAKAHFRAPAVPEKIVCVGKNYRSHAEELQLDDPSHPIIFIKPDTCVNHPEADIPYPSSISRLDYEGELAVLISRRASRIKAQNVADYICGYTIMNDVTARDVQFADGQWTRAKSYDGFAPIGPFLETNLSPDALTIITRVNGEMRQHGSTADMTWNIPRLLEFITEAITLEPGDLVSTGSPAGTGEMQIGDVVEIEIPEIGVLRNTVRRRRGD